MLVLLVLAGCSSAPPAEPVQPTSELVCPTPKQRLAAPEPIQQVEVVWEVLTHDRLPDDAAWARISLTPEQYENLSKNYAEITRWVEQARGQLEYYRVD